MPPHPSAHGFIQPTSVVTNARAHTGKRWVLNIDLEDFFPTVNFGRIRGLFLKPPFDMAPAAATVCAQIVTYRNGLPQGAPTSPVLSNLIAVPLDRALLRLVAPARASTYSRYADDITFSTDLTQFPASLAMREQMAGGALKRRRGRCAVESRSRPAAFASTRKQGSSAGPRRAPERDRLSASMCRSMSRASASAGCARCCTPGASSVSTPPATSTSSAIAGRDMSNRPHEPGPAFRNIVYGHLAFVKMVRGQPIPCS